MQARRIGPRRGVVCGVGLSGAALLGLTLWWATQATDSPEQTSPAPVQPEPVASPVPVPTPAPTAPEPTITLTVDSNPPGAAVILDGAELGRTPLVLEVPARPQGSLQIKKEGFLVWSEVVSLDASAMVRAPLKPLRPADAPRPFRTTR